MCPSSPKKRGAPPGNANARKYGLYSRHFSSRELRSLDRDVSGWLKDEMDLLRVTISSAANSVLQQSETEIPFREHISALKTISLAIARLQNLIRTRAIVFRDPDKREQEIDTLLASMDETRQQEIQAQQARGGAGATTGSPVMIDSSIAEAPPGMPNSFPVPSSSNKRCGAPPGNTNAYKHGFYSRLFTPSEEKLLQEQDLDQLCAEESLLRVMLLRTWHSMRAALPGGISRQEYFYALRAVTYATSVIERLQITRRRLFGGTSQLERDIKLGLELACADLGITNYLEGMGKK